MTSVSLALGDKGDAAAASARAALGLQHAEAFAAREGETAEAARGVLNEVSGAAVIIGNDAGGVGDVVIFKPQHAHSRIPSLTCRSLRVDRMAFCHFHNVGNDCKKAQMSDLATTTSELRIHEIPRVYGAARRRRSG